MELNQQNIGYVANLVQTFATSTKPEQVQAATAELEKIAPTPGYTQVLLHLLQQNINAPPPMSQCYAVCFKSHIMKYWVPDEDEEDVLSEADRTAVKKSLVDLILVSPPMVKAQLIQSMGIISHADFPRKWPELLPLLSTKLSADVASSVTILDAINSMFFFYRSAFASDALWEEIKHVHETFFPTLKTSFQTYHVALQQAVAAKDVAAIKLAAEAMQLTIDIFVSLNAQDIAAYTEDSMADWFPTMLAELAIPTDVLPHADEDVPSQMDKLHTAIVHAAALFAGKYEEAFAPFVQQYLQAIWVLLTSKSVQTRFDDLTAECTAYLEALARRAWYKELFTPEVLTAIVNSVLVPFVATREADEERFVSDPQGYVSVELEGDTASRRGHVVKLISALLGNFEEPLTAMLKTHIAQLSQGDWRCKEQAVRLVMAVAVKSQTKAEGATSLNAHIDLGSFFGEQVLAQLRTNPETDPILKATCLRFISLFRGQLPASFLPQAVDIMVGYLGSQEYVVHTFAATALEQLLALTNDVTNADGTVTKTPRVPPSVLDLKVVFTRLFGVLASHPDSRENVAVMSAILRVLLVVGDAVLPLANDVITQIIGRLVESAQSQTSAKYIHLLFEVVATLIKSLCKAGGAGAVTQFEQLLFPLYQQMLASEFSSDVQPYIFQTLALLLEHRTDISAPYVALFPSLLNATLWDVPANCAAIVRLFVAYLAAGYGAQLAPAHLTAMLGVYQKLNSVPKYDAFSNELARAVYYFLPSAAVMPLLGNVLKLQFQRLTKKKTDTYMAGLTMFWGMVAVKHGAGALLQAMESVQAGVSAMALNKVWAPTLLVMSGAADKRIALRGTLALLQHMLTAMPADPLTARFASAAMGIAKTYNTSLSVLTATGDVLTNVSESFGGSYARLVCSDYPGYNFAPQPLKAMLLELNTATSGALVGVLGQCSPDAQQAYKEATA